MLEYLGYLDMDGASKGTYAGRTEGAVKLFQMNYCLDITGTINNVDFMKITRVYIDVKHKNADIQTKKDYYQSNVNTLKKADNAVDRTGRKFDNRSYYCDFYEPREKKNRNHLSQVMKNAGVKQKYEAAKNIVYYDFTIPINNLVKVNINTFLNKRITTNA